MSRRRKNWKAEVLPGTEDYEEFRVYKDKEDGKLVFKGIRKETDEEFQDRLEEEEKKVKEEGWVPPDKKLCDNCELYYALYVVELMNNRNNVDGLILKKSENERAYNIAKAFKIKESDRINRDLKDAVDHNKEVLERRLTKDDFKEAQQEKSFFRRLDEEYSETDNYESYRGYVPEKLTYEDKLVDICTKLNSGERISEEEEKWERFVLEKLEEKYKKKITSFWKKI